jgi:tetratricopeptide (TPR) repeat protein
MSKKKDPEARKKAVLKKQRRLAEKALVIERQNTLPEYKKLNYTITWDPIIDDNVVLLAPEVEQQKQQIYNDMNNPGIDPTVYIEQLETLCQQYPDDKTFGNFLAAVYDRAGDKAKSIQMIKDNYQKRPDYLFAKFQMAELYIEEGAFDKVYEMFDGKLDLKQLFPERDTFHISEVKSMLYTAARYHDWAGDLKTFSHCYGILEEIEPNGREVLLLMPLIMENRVMALMDERKSGG